MEWIQKLDRLFARQPDVLHGVADISYSEYAPRYACALVFAVPFGGRMTLRGYREEDFHRALLAARSRIDGLTASIEELLRESGVDFYTPELAQRDERELRAPFSFKYAAVRAGLGWIGKNDVLITERYGPEQRLRAILIGQRLPCGAPTERSRCPEGCDACVRACPHHALTGAMWSPSALRSELIDYQLCNQRRSAYIAKHGRKHECGLCLAACPIGREPHENRNEDMP